MEELAIYTKGEVPISHADENWEALPQRLRGRGEYHINNGRIKDAELMFDAATEIERLRASINHHQGTR